MSHFFLGNLRLINLAFKIVIVMFALHYSPFRSPLFGSHLICARKRTRFYTRCLIMYNHVIMKALAHDVLTQQPVSNILSVTFVNITHSVSNMISQWGTKKSVLIGRFSLAEWWSLPKYFEGFQKNYSYLYSLFYFRGLGKGINISI